MKKVVLGGLLALFVTAGAVYAYRTVRATMERGDGTIVFTCPLTGQPICHGTCPMEGKAEQPACCKKPAEGACCKKPAEANP